MIGRNSVLLGSVCISVGLLLAACKGGLTPSESTIVSEISAEGQCILGQIVTGDEDPFAIGLACGNVEAALVVAVVAALDAKPADAGVGAVSPTQASKAAAVHHFAARFAH